MLCRLCLKNLENYDDFLHIFDALGMKLEIASVLRKYFWFQAKPSDTISQIICQSCWTKVSDFNDFYLCIQNKHQKTINELLFPTHQIETTDATENTQRLVEVEWPPQHSVNSQQNESSYATEMPLIGQSFLANDDTIDDSEMAASNHNSDEKNSLKEEDIENKEYLIKKEIPIPIKGRRGRPRTRNLNTNESVRNSDQQVSYRFICNLCGKEAPNRNALQSHQHYMHSPKFACNFCNRSFKRLIVLNEHVASSHTHKPLYTCANCPRTFASKSNMYMHTKRHHPIQLEEARNKRFRKRIPLTDVDVTAPVALIKMEENDETHSILMEVEYQATEEGVKIETQAVDKTDDDKLVEKVHQESLATSSLSKPYSGAIKRGRPCKGVSGIVLSTTHQGNIFDSWRKIKSIPQQPDAHLNENHALLECKIEGGGGSKSNESNTLVGNLKRSYKCDVCEKGFTRKIILKEHFASRHSGEQLYKCPYCAKTSTSNGNMYLHRKRFHPKEFEEERKRRVKKQFQPAE